MQPLRQVFHYDNMQRRRIGLGLLIICFLFSGQSGYAIDISDEPMATRIQTAPANIMFVLDNSGSMDFSFMVQGTDNGTWGPGNNLWYNNALYVFDDAGDNIFGYGVLSGDDRAQWQSQWSGANSLYYNPQVDYQPWPLPNQDPATDGIERMPDADPTTPVSNPYGSATVTLDMTDVYYTVPAEQVIVDDADAGFTFTGPWIYWTNSSTWNGSLRYVQNNGVATFTPTFSQAGTYDVDGWWNCYTSSDQNATITVINSGATSPDTVSMDQRSNCGGWIPIGTYDFAAGNAGSVSIARHAGSTGGYTIADAVRFVQSGLSDLDIYNSHYYTQEWIDTNGDGIEDPDELTSYLVNFNNGVRDVYLINDQNDNDIIDGTGELVFFGNELPASIRPDLNAAEELQNFANWYSYYRKRELAAKVAVANVIADSSGIQVGFYSLHDNNGGVTRQSVLPVRLAGQGDDTNVLLTSLYTMDSNGGTPLRTSLQNVGRYFDDTDGNGGGLGNSPYYTEEDGGACQHAFAIVITDGFWNGSSPGVGNADSGEGAPYEDGNSSTLADVAMYYYNRNLSSLPDEVPTTDCDDNDQQHMVTFSVSFGLSGTIDIEDINGNGTPDDLEDFSGDGSADGLNYENDPCFLDANTPRPSWPNPQPDLPSTIDDLWHAAVNGRGQFYSASDPEKLGDSLVEIFQAIESITASGAAVALSGDILTADTRVYQTDYNSETWSGDLVAYSFDSNGDIDLDNPIWRASNRLNTVNWDTGRRIMTYNDATLSGVPFRYGDLSTGQQGMLDAVVTTAQNIVYYIRGNTAIPGFRQRLDADFNINVLGDIVDSEPVVVDDTIYVSANDGMLHAFNIETGDERFAYIPRLVYEDLWRLKELVFEHRFFVNATPVIEKNVGVSDITLLVGGLGKGGKGYYALDVSSADSIDGSFTESSLNSIVEWEYPAGVTVDDDMGFSYSKPFIVQSNDNGRWVVIFGNGYNSTNGHAVLYVLDALTGTLITKLDTNIGNDNGLSTPALIDPDNDNKVDVVYAGDLHGNLWKFDLRDSNPTNWTVAFSGSALFSADGPSTNNNPQPITTKPAVMKHPLRHGLMVVFGTGKFLGESDRIDTDTQTLYGIWDFSDSDNSEFLGTFTRPGLGNLSGVELLMQEEVFSDTFTDPDAQSQITTFGSDGSDGGPAVHLLRITSDYTADWAVDSDTPFPDPTVHAGWYFDLPILGERTIEDPLIRERRLIALTVIPEDGYCQGGGWTIINEMDALDGSRLASPSFDTTGVESGGTNDGRYLVNESDKINLTALTGETGASGGNLWVAATGILRPGGGILHLSESSIVELPGTTPTLEMKILSSSEGNLDEVIELAPRRGIAYWREH